MILNRVLIDLLLTCRQHDIVLKRIAEDDRTPEIDQLHDTVLVDDNVVKLEITMCQSHLMQITHTTDDLQRGASDLVSCHLTSHDRSKQIERCVLHDLVPLALLVDDVDSLDHVAVVQSRADTELGGDLFVVLPLGLVGVAIAELLHSECGAIACTLHETHRASSARTEDLAKLAVLGDQAVIVRKWHVRRLRTTSRRRPRAISRL